MKFYQEKPHKCFRFSVHLANRQPGLVLLDQPGVCRCELRKIGSDPEKTLFEKKQNYAARLPGGDDLAIEAEIRLHSDLHPEWKSLRIGIPLSEVPGITDFDIVYTGTLFQLQSGGKTLDEEFPFGDPPGEVPPENRLEECRFASHDPVLRTMSLHGWHPEGLNEWAGDVSVGFFRDEFHIFYLRGRRHHGSGFGTGSHRYYHFVTRDFRTWRDDGCILPFEAQWQTFGTGTPFAYNGKIMLTYGFHTSRYLPEGMGIWGGTWAESEDGLHFKHTCKIFTPSENPSVFNGADGKLYIFSGYNTDTMGLVVSEQWPELKKAGPEVIPSGENSVTDHSLECPCWFQWHGKHFLILGFRGMYSADTPEFTNARDLAAEGWDVYDGLGVPMVASFVNDRRILVGWLPITGWGGTLGLRELVWFDDGVPGIRWMEEAMPKITDLRTEEACCSFNGNGYVEFEMQPGEDLSVQLEGRGKPLMLCLDAKRKYASISTEENCPVLREQTGNWRKLSKPGFAADHLRNLDKPYRVRLMVTEDRKWNGCIADVEIAGCRTLLCHFENVHPTRFRVVKGLRNFLHGEIENPVLGFRPHKA